MPDFSIDSDDHLTQIAAAKLRNVLCNLNLKKPPILRLNLSHQLKSTTTETIWPKIKLKRNPQNYNGAMADASNRTAHAFSRLDCILTRGINNNSSKINAKHCRNHANPVPPLIICQQTHKATNPHTIQQRNSIYNNQALHFAYLSKSPMLSNFISC